MDQFIEFGWLPTSTVKTITLAQISEAYSKKDHLVVLAVSSLDRESEKAVKLNGTIFYDGTQLGYISTWIPKSVITSDPRYLDFESLVGTRLTIRGSKAKEIVQAFDGINSPFVTIHRKDC